MSNRLLKDSIRTSESIDQLSPEGERLFYRLLLVAEDWGRFDANPKVLISFCFPLKTGSITPEMMNTWLQELAAVEIITLYTVDGKNYGAFAQWAKHNNMRNKHSKFPEPPVSTCEHLQTIASNCEQLSATASNCEHLLTYTDTDTDTDTDYPAKAEQPDGVPPLRIEVPTPYQRAEAVLTGILEHTGGDPPKPQDIRRHLKPECPLQMLVKAFGVEETVAMYAHALGSWRGGVTWPGLYEQRNAIRVQMQSKAHSVEERYERI